MKIKPSTLALVLVALGLGGIVLLVQQQPAPKSSNSEAGEQVVSEEEKPIFGFKEEDIQAFTLQTQLRTLKFERDKQGKWQMLQPEKTAASDPSIAFLLDLVTTGKTKRTITASASDREQFGLHQPMATINLTLKDQKTHKLVIGEYDFNRSFLYAQADPPAEATDSLNVLLVSPNFDNAVNRPLDEWKQPATAEKSSPAPASPAASPQASPAESLSPDATPSKSPAEPPANQP